MRRNRARRTRRARSESFHFWVAVIVVVVALAAGYYYYLWPKYEMDFEPFIEEPGEKPDTTGDQEQPGLKGEVDEPGPKYVVPAPLWEKESEPAEDTQTEDEVDDQAPERQALPELDESDEAIRKELEDLSDDRVEERGVEEPVPGNDATEQPRFEQLFIPESIIRHFVVTIDNMTREKLPQKYGFTEPPPRQFQVKEIGDERYQIDPATYQRYERYVAFAEERDINRLVSLYVRYYPLFQQAYEELGYPDRYFNDRLVAVIDHLLATPEVERPIELVRPKVFYQFADPELEGLSAGRKLMIRIGPDNAARVKSMLRELRTSLTTLSANRSG